MGRATAHMWGQGIWGTGSHLPPSGCEDRTQAFKLSSKLPSLPDCFLRCHFVVFPCKHFGKQSWVWFSRLLFCFSCCCILVLWAESSLDQGLSSVNGKGGFIFSLSQYLFIYLDLFILGRCDCRRTTLSWFSPSSRRFLGFNQGHLTGQVLSTFKPLLLR